MTCVPPTYQPPLTLIQTGGRLRLRLGDVCHGYGETLQQAADDLVHRLLGYLMALRSSGMRVAPGMGVDLQMFNFLYELAEIAARGDDIRPHLFA